MEDNTFYEFDFLANLSWSVPFYGSEYEKIFVGENGRILFNETDSSYGDIADQENADNYAIISPLWIDLGSETPSIRISICGYNNHAIIRWTGNEYTKDNIEDFELQIERTDKLYFQYNNTTDVNHDLWAGISFGDRDHLTQIAYNDGTVPASNYTLTYEQ